MPYIRKALLSDAQAIHDIRNAAICAGSSGYYSPDLIARWTEGDLATAGFCEAVRNSFYVAELGGQVVGTGAIDIASGKLDAIFVSPSHMKTGLGRTMLQFLEQLAIANGIASLHLESTLNAERFYTRNGFSRVRNAKYESPRGFSLDCIVMKKVLQNARP
ncbi:GNAT family N-acetyltransferase [Undibacterium sp. Ren11W]|uniref:GNAT family N-acetyltransferase n=1 Tax=Undibacterium sp. Ren11W TaxID=3413045 RepID=UPI003BF45A1C